MVAIHKSEAKSVVTNYRGISLFDILSKVLEKQVYDKLSNSVKSHICKWQCGFLPGRSTISQLIEVVNEYQNMRTRRHLKETSSRCYLLRLC